jgi:hypothetical protein
MVMLLLVSILDHVKGQVDGDMLDLRGELWEILHDSGYAHIIVNIFASAGF